MKKMLFFGFLFLSVSLCYSNDGTWSMRGGSLQPINNVDVSLDYERLAFLRRGGNWEVEVYIELNNQTNEPLRPLVGFEFYSGPADFPLHVLLVNGEPQQFEGHMNYDGDPSVLLYTPELQPGINKVYHNYVLREGRVSLEGNISYVLQTGARWKGGTIGEIEIVVKSDGPGVLRTRTNSFSEFEIIGEGRVFTGYFSSDDHVERDGRRPHYYPYDTTYSLNRGYLYRRLENFAPVQNINFDFQGFEYGGYSADVPQPRNFLPYHYTTGAPLAPLLPFGYIYNWEQAYISNRRYFDYNGNDEGLLSTLFEEGFLSMSPENKRILRNTVYAMHGYIFNDAELQSFFDEQFWYFPNPNITLENIRLSEVAKGILQFMVRSERN